MTQTDGIAFTPVIMAAGEHRELWPLSRVNVPIQFLRDAKGVSPFLAWLAFFDAIAEADRPTVVVAAGAIESARRQIAEAGIAAHVVVLPSSRGIRAATCVAALLQDGETRLVFADAPTPPSERTAFVDVLDGLAAAHAAAGGTVLSALPVAGGADIRRGERCQHGLIRPGARPDGPARSGYRVGPLWTATATEIVAGIAGAAPDTVRVCQGLVSRTERVGGEVWIDAARWSHLDKNPRRLVALTTLTNAKLRPVALQADDEGRPIVRSNVTEGDVHVIDSRSCDVRSRDHLTVLAGCENLRVLATGDATLVAAPGHEKEIEGFVRDLWLAERPEAFAHRRERHGWGHESELFRTHDYRVRMIEIEPGRTLRADNGDRPETWLIARGAANLHVAGRECRLTTGASTIVPPGSAYSCCNLSDERLIAIAVETTQRSHVAAPPLEHAPPVRDGLEQDPHQPPQRQSDQEAEAEALVERLQRGREETPAD